MIDRVRTTARRGLRLRSSPHDGETLSVLPTDTALEVLDRQPWLRVRAPDGSIGFVSGEWVEPDTEAEEQPAEAPIIRYASEGHVIHSDRPIEIHRDFEAVLDEVARIASDNGVRLFVTSSLRRPDQPVRNAVVEPALRSNHHAGHAIDMNVEFEQRSYRSAQLARDAWNREQVPVSVRKFLEDLEDDTRHRLRWGGNFSRPDPIHIDDGLNVFDRQRFEETLESIWVG